MKQRNRKLACLCITAALLATANTTTAVARESKEQTVENETYTLHAGATSIVKKAVEEEKEAIQMIIDASEKELYTAESEANEEENYEDESELAVAQVSSYINVRNMPGVEGEIIGKLHNNSVGEIIGEEGEWLKIRSGSVEGYIKAEYALRGEEGLAKADEVGERLAKVATMTLRVREEATTESRIVGLLPEEHILPVSEEVEGWVKIATAEGEGYVSSDYVEVYTKHQVAESKEEEEERLRKEEEERQAAEAAARAEEARRASSAQKNQNPNRGASNSAAASTGGSSQSVPAVSTGSGLGHSIANFALQFVGNPYVYGGTSLTNGADCSGFVMSVFKNFGISLPRTSGEQGKCGTDVGGIGNAKAGDLVSYSGHIGIYIGNGQIVHASSAKTGIKISNANYRPILSVRRIV